METANEPPFKAKASRLLIEGTLDGVFLRPLNRKRASSSPRGHVRYIAQVMKMALDYPI